MTIDTFTGGIFETNCFYLPESGTLIDAPQESAGWLRRAGHRVKWLLLTHGHIDHTWDAAEIQKEHEGCQIACHPDTVPLVTERDFFLKLGLNWEIDPVRVDLLLEETSALEVGGVSWQILFVPGHCPGSLAFYRQDDGVLFSGDTLFNGSIGRTDLPGGDHELLLTGIREKIFALADGTKVLSGHGPGTTVGQERRLNPYVGAAADF